MRYRGTHPPGSCHTSRPQPETMRYINKVQRYASSRILSYFPTSAWNNEVHQWGTEVCVLQDLIVLPDLSLKQWGTSMRYRGMCPPGSYRTSRPQPETMRYINEVQRYVSFRILLYLSTSAWNNEVHQWGTEVCVLQDLIVLINLNLKQWGASMRFRGMCSPGSYRTSWPQPETMRYSSWPQPKTTRYINEVHRYVSSSIQSVWLHHVLTSYSCWLTVPSAISFSAYLTRHVFICLIFLYMSGCVNIGSSISLCPFFR